MTGRTHRSGGALAGLIWIGVAQPSSPVAMAVMLGASIYGSLLPDIDHGQSSIAHSLGPVSRVGCSAIQGVFGHRGVVHSLLFCLLFGVAGFLLTMAFGEAVLQILENYIRIKNINMVDYAAIVGTGFCIGAVSHLVYDMGNPQGCKPLAPFLDKKVSVLPITTSSPLETMIFYPASLAANLVMVIILLKMGIISDIAYWFDHLNVPFM